MGMGITGCTPTHAPLPSVTTPSSAEKLSMYEKNLDKEWEALLADFPDATRPEVDLVRFVSLEDWPLAYSECLTERGFPATVSEDGGVGTQVRAGQEQAAAMARYECGAEYPTDPKYTVPLNDSQLEYIYAYFTGELMTCLTDKGIAVENVPSLQTFQEEYYTEKGWTPYSSIDPGARDNMMQDCPETPSGIYGE